jgi:hypothetical protein
VRRQRHPAPAHRFASADLDGKVGRPYKTIWAEFFTPKDRMFATVAEHQLVPDACVLDYNTVGRTGPAAGNRPSSGSGSPTGF